MSTSAAAWCHWCKNESVSDSCATVVSSTLSLLVGVLLICGIIIANTITLIVLLLNPALRTANNLPILSLASSDLIVGVISAPIHLYYNVNGDWPGDQVLCSTWMTLSTVAVTGSIYSLCVMAVHRYRAVVRPLKYRPQLARRRIQHVLCAIWLASACIGVLSLLLRGQRMGPCYFDYSLSVTVIFLIAIFVAPMSVITFCYIAIYLAVRSANSVPAQQPVSSQNGVSPQVSPQQQSSVSCQNGGETEDSPRQQSPLSCQNGGETEVSPRRDSVSSSPATSLSIVRVHPNPDDEFSHELRSHIRAQRKLAAQRDRRILFTLGCMICALQLSFVPFIIRAIIGTSYSLCQTSFWKIYLLDWILFTNSFFNPVIYVVLNSEFRKEIKHTWKKHVRRTFSHHI